MSVPLPRDPRERIRVMVNLARGHAMTYTVDGRRVNAVPRQSADKPQGKEKPQTDGK